MTELTEILTYWKNKYPNIDVNLWSNNDKTIYYGKMLAFGSATDLSATTIGELIAQGEKFLRTIT